MKLKLLAVLLSTVCVATTAHAAKNNPSPEFEKAALEYVNSLDPTKPVDCLRQVQTELTAMQLNMQAHNPNGIGYIKSDTVKAIFKKAQELKKACRKIRPYQNMTGDQYRAMADAWIPWMIRTGWNKKEGWTAYTNK